MAIAEDLTFKRNKTSGEAALFKLVVTLIETYETEHYPAPEVAPHEILRHLMESSSSSSADLAAIAFRTLFHTLSTAETSMQQQAKCIAKCECIRALLYDRHLSRRDVEVRKWRKRNE